MSDELDESQWPALITLGEVVLAVYVPFVWTLFSKVPVLPEHRIGSFLLMPVYLPKTLLFDLTGSPVCEILCQMFAIFIVAGLACWGSHGGAKRIVAVVGGFVGALLLSIGTVILLNLHSASGG
jgi:hypothetical protein